MPGCVSKGLDNCKFIELVSYLALQIKDIEKLEEGVGTFQSGDDPQVIIFLYFFLYLYLPVAVLCIYLLNPLVNSLTTLLICPYFFVYLLNSFVYLLNSFVYLSNSFVYLSNSFVYLFNSFVHIYNFFVYPSPFY